MAENRRKLANRVTESLERRETRARLGGGEWGRGMTVKQPLRGRSAKVILLGWGLLGSGYLARDLNTPAGAPPARCEKGATDYEGSPTRCDPAGEIPPWLDGKPLDLNRATASDLERLPGIGPRLARTIFEYRSEHGAFTHIDELADVPGVGAKTVARLTPYLSVGTTPARFETPDGGGQ